MNPPQRAPDPTTSLQAAWKLPPRSPGALSSPAAARQQQYASSSSSKAHLAQLRTSPPPGAPLASLPCSPTACTPRRYIRVLSGVVGTLGRHAARLSPACRQAVQELAAVLKTAGQTYTSAPSGKLHHYLTEDLQMQQVQAAAAVAHRHIAATARACTDEASEFKADITELLEALADARCLLPPSQMHLIEAFRNLCLSLDPACEIPDFAAKEAQQIVRDVIKEVHGPFFNSEVLEREVSHLLRVASTIDPASQRCEAAATKLLAATLLDLDGDEEGDDDEEGGLDSPCTANDPYLIPAFGMPALQLLADGAAAATAAAAAAAAAGEQGAWPSAACGPLSPATAAAAAAVGAQLDGDLQQHEGGAAGSGERQRKKKRLLSIEVAPAGDDSAGFSGTGTAATGATVAPKQPLASSAPAAAAGPAAGAGPYLWPPAPAAAVPAAGPGPQRRHPAALLWPPAPAAGSGQQPSPSAVFVWPPAPAAAAPVAAAAAAAAAAAPAAALPAAAAAAAATASSAIDSSASSSTSLGTRMLAEFMSSSLSTGSSSSSSSEARRSCTFHANIKLADEGVERLAQFLGSTRRVRGLSLAHNQIGPQGAERLCKALLAYCSIQTLELPDNQLGNEGAVAVADLLDAGCPIKSLALSDNGITNNGAIRLADAVARCRTLERLSIHNNAIGTSGCRALAAAVAANRALKTVEFLPGNCAPTREIKQLARAIKQNRKFKLRHLFACTS